MQVWDCAGNESFMPRNPRVKQSDAFVIVFDITSRPTFEKVRMIHKENEGICGAARAREQVTIIVGTKTDLAYNREV